MIVIIPQIMNSGIMLVGKCGIFVTPIEYVNQEKYVFFGMFDYGH